ncbi:transposase [Limnothrix sp. FACHB-881]|uniref:REP-associated tyrosine transposase n=1 Tax=Limnothrix sp. FACHB-881 TaxID=2692819 RepID=UPI001685E032|nr:transposase [Limnothrix sp. FACHB-881]MBD2634769.1 transposase [Limnothrix sp. FACHB-881]
MPNYRRWRSEGGTYFFTAVTYGRYPWLCEPIARQALRQAIRTTQAAYPFSIDAWVLLPDHLHCIWTLPTGDDDFSTRWRLIKTRTTRVCNRQFPIDLPSSRSRQTRGDHPYWQRRFWEHQIRDEADFQNHIHYIHQNPVKHGHAITPTDWPYSTIHRSIDP